MFVHGESVSWSNSHNSRPIVITCINMMRLIVIDSQMIAKAKIWILLYNDFVVSHTVSLEEKQRI